MTTAALATLFDVSHETIRQWRKKGMPARVENGRPAFLLSEVIPWRRERDKSEAKASEAPDLAIEQARKARADADLSELRVAQMREELVPVADVEREVERLCSVLRARVLSVRGRWAPKVLGLATMAEATATLDALAQDVMDALRGAADELEDVPDQPEPPLGLGARARLKC